MKKPRKIKISHHEVDVKLFLEIMAIYVILISVLTGVYLLEPTITGFITASKQINYVDNDNLEFNEASEYVWSVRFNTIGIGTLTISAVNSTYAEYFNDDVTTINDLEILEVKCGDFEIFSKEKLIDTQNFWFVLENNSKIKLIDLIGQSLPIKSVYIKDYSCDEIWQYTVKVLTECIHTQEFNFENKKITVKSINKI